MNDLTITVNGQAFDGWQEVAISRSIEQMADTFSLKYTDQTGFDQKPIAIFEGDAATVKIDGEAIITGYVDDSARAYGVDTSEMSVEGRSKIGDLVDCAAVYRSGEWNNAKLIDIVKAICQPFGVTVEVQGGVDANAPFRRYCLQDGETAAEAIDRACKMRGVLLTSTADGSLLLTRVGTTRVSTILQYGTNVLSGRYSGSWKDRFSQYTIKAQAYGDDEDSGDAAAFIKRHVHDTFINRYRPTIMQAENEDSGSELEKRVAWERNVRSGRSRRLEYSVQGWKDDDGKLWTPNTIVRIDDSFLRLRDELLIVSAAFTRGLAGTTTQLTLSPRSAYDVQPLPAKKPKRTALEDQ